MNLNSNLICGILNVTPDSFSDGGKYISPDKASEHALKMIEEGADFIDIGGESSRPFSEPVSLEEELKRVIPVIKEIRKKTDVVISIDTYKPELAYEALKAGANIINDINGFRNRYMVEVAKKFVCPVIIMHMKGSPRDMQVNPIYEDVVLEIKNFFSDQIKILKQNGIKEIILDPGIGFGKTLEHNLEIIRRLGEIKELECPIMIGVSRKSFLGKITNENTPEKRMGSSITANLISLLNGANIFRVHDVKETIDAIKVAEYLMLKR